MPTLAAASNFLAPLLLTAIAALVLPACVTNPNPDLPLEFQRGNSWKTLTLADFENVNGTEDTWKEVDGVILCSGIPNGGARTHHQYKNFELTLQWKHHTYAGNSGVFLWCPESAFTDLPPGQLPRTGIEV
ncbi:MAG: DUF1080 domain-containing protein, partial [Planctomycetota bacterium]|nr:DUF1080 domain-containing protein [Planctomycetota bacterium]